MSRKRRSGSRGTSRDQLMGHLGGIITNPRLRGTAQDQRSRRFLLDMASTQGGVTRRNYVDQQINRLLQTQNGYPADVSTRMRNHIIDTILEN
ncbi:hypothetical protein M408DRAFT_257331 [Serendipita vermifera MAFF 305830]|uniref:Uncharacterized protein n=1 Tax=Serendipita vermifera MAFF 305830 TaxID=933852 RepID=A0A0C2WYZ6_SERVB|nr:hypothetical protein M408DRAFT_257331 [Serendipita vermifera MAFF 305830]